LAVCHSELSIFVSFCGAKLREFCLRKN